MCSSPDPPEQPEPAAKPAPPPAKEAPRAPVTGADQNDTRNVEQRDQSRQAAGTNRLRIRFNAPKSSGSGISIPTSG